MAGRFSQFRDDLLIELVRTAENHPGHYVSPKDAADKAGLQYLAGWVRQAVGTLENSGWVKVSYALGGGPDGGMHLTVTGEGLEAAEELLAARDEEAEEDKQIPAAGRVVRIDHNSASCNQAKESLLKVTEAVQGNNEYAARESEDHEQRLAELEAGARLLKAATVRVDAIISVPVAALKYLAKKFVDSAIGVLAVAAIAALAALLGMPL